MAFDVLLCQAKSCHSACMHSVSVFSDDDSQALKAALQGEDYRSTEAGVLDLRVKQGLPQQYLDDRVDLCSLRTCSGGCRGGNQADTGLLLSSPLVQCVLCDLDLSSPRPSWYLLRVQHWFKSPSGLGQSWYSVYW